MASGGGAAARMDPEVATELVRKGATLLLLDVPQRTLFGIDTQMFSVGPKFKGMKMVPPGAHFVYYCSPNRHGNEFAPTVGFFLTTHQSEGQEEVQIFLLQHECKKIYKYETDI
ncbi:AAR2 protein family [Zea mays]|uniref:AAR2 protein family n=1 Tax=Zea mays TaxID=4577 RepID=A0A1D6EFH0_MAIZE|nr:AAR2 protein family [Zea mays]